MSAVAPMQVPRHKRQIFLFVIAILAPAVVLVGLAGRMMYQDRELASRREADQQRKRQSASCAGNSTLTWKQSGSRKSTD
jgi:hypothetical protein